MDTRKVAQQYRINKWVQVISECRRSGQSIRTWCAENNIKESSYYYWLRRIRKAACETLPTQGAEENQIVEVNIPTCEFSQEPFDRGPSPEIVLRIDSIVMEIHKNAAPALIKDTLRALNNVR